MQTTTEEVLHTFLELAQKKGRKVELLSCWKKTPVNIRSEETARVNSSQTI
jgi:hypothetical protein